MHVHSGLLHQFPVGEDRVFQFLGDIHGFDPQIKAPVLNTGKFQQLRNHTGQTFRFF